MVAGLPWYLLAFGVVLVIVGFILASLPRSPSQDRRALDSDMDDDDIVRELKRAERIPIPSLIILAGFACVLISICWRFLRTVL
jgi:hypothetical protein